MTKEQVDSALKQLKLRLTSQFQNGVRLFLFGSVARGDYEFDSDIDVLVLVDGILTAEIEEKIVEIAYPIELEYAVVFGLVVYSKEFWNSQRIMATPFRKTVEKEGVPL